ncbi:MAG: adenylosuccinate synthetase [Eubacterium sp.]|nr:adenylosuccinate synthetase [Eubacterium sp.]MCM1302589.1 adenylosuccinate synthetase [Butyrivibrio sp.]MCM1342282.1 adenylosuccinate synthetase [Muribaculaceae bacterium]MCM1410923.1 adenylosuccinate synthetase [Lachnospiraceae bacterium]
MVEVKAVIGKNFGDEGKGQTVDFLCGGKNALVLRHNGGAQSGHTVEEGDFRFVFHQLGSGSFQGCPTYWCRTFLPDLLKLGEEMTDAEKAGMDIRTVYAHPDCACVTVYDVLLNSLKEQLRGKDRHGSCGMGIFETVLRSREHSFALRLCDFESRDTHRILERLRHIRDHYAIPRLTELKNKYPSSFSLPGNAKWAELIGDDNVLYNSAEIMCENYGKYVTLADWPHMAAQYDTLIFENGQGLMLDWDNEEYAPHLTASHTGLKNVAELLNELEAGRKHIPYTLEIIYVSRTYVTRHGAGRLDHECAREAIHPAITDRTNVYNPWQDSLRYGRHPAGEDFFRYIRKDLEWLKLLPYRAFSVALYLTHLDETRGKVLFSDGGMDLEAFRRYCMEESHCISTVLPRPYTGSYDAF